MAVNQHVTVEFLLGEENCRGRNRVSIVKQNFLSQYDA